MELPISSVNLTYSNASVHLSWNRSKHQYHNSNISGQSESLGPPDYMYAYVTVFCSVIFLVGVLGNTLVIQVVIRIRSMRRRMNYFLVCLSVADLLVLLVALPSGLQEFYGKEKWFIGGTMCKLVVFSENVAHHSSVLTLLAIGFERYFAICHPLKETIGARLSSEKVLIPVVWLLSSFATLPFALFYGTEVGEFADGTLAERCTFKDLSKTFEKGYIIFIFIVFFAVPIVLLTLMYTAISLTIATSTVPSAGDFKICSRSFRSSCRQVRLHEKTSVSSNKALTSRRQVIRVMIAIMCMYFVCLLPLRCLQIWTLFATNDDYMRLGHEGYLNLINCSRILVYVNSAGDPIIYGLLCSNFRAAFKKSFFSCRNSGQDGVRKNTALFTNQYQSSSNVNQVKTTTILKETENGHLVETSFPLCGRQLTDKLNETVKRGAPQDFDTSTDFVTCDCSLNGKSATYV